MNITRFLAVPAVAGGILLVAACGPSGGSGATSQTPAASALSAAASATQAQAAESAVATVAGKCQPKGLSVNLWIAELVARKSVREDFAKCEAIPQGDGPAVGACVLSAAEAAHASTADKAAKQAAFIVALGNCVNSLGATASASASASASAT